jgi:hypothetical protein
MVVIATQDFFWVRCDKFQPHLDPPDSLSFILKKSQFVLPFWPFVGIHYRSL